MQRALAAGLAGMRQNFKPGMILWAVGAALLAGYYLWPAARPVYDTAAGWKRDGGYWFSAISTGLCGGLVPFLFLWLSRRIPAGEACATGIFLVIFWIYRGVEVDLFYRLQGQWFGDGNDLRTVAIKTAMDMGVYTAFWSIPTTTLAYFWFFDSGRSWARFRSGMSRDLFTVRLPALTLSAWAVWGPTVCIVYSLPPALQMPVFCIVLCFWVLLVSAVAAPSEQGSA